MLQSIAHNPNMDLSLETQMWTITVVDSNLVHCRLSVERLMLLAKFEKSPTVYGLFALLSPNETGKFYLEGISEDR